MDVTDAEGTGRERFHVLIVDDSATQRLLLSAHLRRWGFKVTEAPNGLDALEILRDQPIDLVLTDWVMPGLDGPGLCEAIRGLPDHGFIYVLILTSRTGSAAVSDGLTAGADDFLMKPVNTVELKARLDAGIRIVSMERRLAGEQRATARALRELQSLYSAIEVDLAAAAALQREQLPPTYARANGAEVATLCRFAGHVGGDHVGFFEIGSDMVGLYSIDVAGHGVASALLALRLAQYFAPPDPANNIALTLGPDGLPTARMPEEVMAELNRRCNASMEHDVYFTMAYAVLELDTGHVRICQAGHSPAALLDTSGNVRFNEAGAGPPVGLFEEASYASGLLTLKPGERLILYSDGITEAGTDAGPDGMLGAAGFAGLLAPLSARPVAEMLPELSAALDRVAGSTRIDDDVSAVVIECPNTAVLRPQRVLKPEGYLPA
ncbi:MAG: SpoIIE family protein phosphatase [Pseudomonadota bacterium]